MGTIAIYVRRDIKAFMKKAGLRIVRSDPVTVGAVAVVAYALCDMVHEVLGHGTATLLSQHVKALTLTTVALSTSKSSRVVAAAGTIANLFASVAAFALWRRGSASATFRYFLWLLASLNLFNATGYLLFSGILGIGDWAVVMTGSRIQSSGEAA